MANKDTMGQSISLWWDADGAAWFNRLENADHVVSLVSSHAYLAEDNRRLREALSDLNELHASHASLVEENKRMRELAQRSLEMAKVMEGMTGCRGDDEWVWGLMDDLKSALGDTNA